MTKKKHFENCGRTDGRKDGRTTDATPWHKLIGPFGPDELKTKTKQEYTIFKNIQYNYTGFNYTDFELHQSLY